uniref:Zinc finger, CCHC-type n=1 Tax=Tanacetum cinerariifolium TaxID=118510 RepID=A0A6L2LAD9_TANCI|nr:zinc finger, CCHC-type [Tanacetum cinerariifolium]
MVNAMLISSNLSQDMWGEAIQTASYLLNKIPCKEKEETLYELCMGRKPSYQYLGVWGCLAKVVVPTPKVQKIRPKSVDCIFIGYAKNSCAYGFIVQNGSSSRIDDEVQDKRQRDNNDLHNERQDQLEEEEVEPRRSKRARKDNDKMIKSTKDMLKSKFDMKDMGLADETVMQIGYLIKRILETSGYVFTLGGVAISWKPSKKTVIAKSTMKSEFIALDKCEEEAEWLRQFVEDIPRRKSPMWERSEVASKGIIGGAIPKSSCRTRLVFMTITRTTMRT